MKYPVGVSAADHAAIPVTTRVRDGGPVQGCVAQAKGRRYVPCGTGLFVWVFDARCTAIAPIPVKPMHADLSFATNPRYWGKAFRRGHFETAETDTTLIAAQA